ncbi:winged helix-turn-helix domain-containing protein [Salmonella enterica]|nr:winged helix-turn-helix domain-containing protein [Salmonella enterica]
MLFEIEGRVYFRIDDGAIWEHNDKEGKLILSPIVARLLHLFIKERGRVISREEIMHYVWEKHGLEPSNNSLNQYVSQLRKLIDRFQLPDDSIRTVPREGFVLSSALNIKIDDESELATLTSLNAESPHPIQNLKRTTVTWLTISLFILLISTPFAVINLIDRVHKQRMSVSPEKIGEIRECAVYSVLMGRNSKMKETLSLAQIYMEQNDISCNDRSIVYLFSTGGVLKSQSGRVFLSHCHKVDNEVVSCVDYIYHSWL